MFLVVKKRTIIVLIAVILVGVALFIATGVYVTTTTTMATTKGVVVVDAGHGGIDPGVSGASGAKESEINLSLAKELGKQLKKAGYEVVYTRNSNTVLYLNDEPNKKQADMKRRKDIIENANASLVISLHCNKFPQTERRGAQVFFTQGSEQSTALANNVQTKINELNKTYNGREFDALKGEYYILLCSKSPSILVECGFLSNAEDEKLLISVDYQEKICQKIIEGLAA